MTEEKDHNGSNYTAIVGRRAEEPKVDSERHGGARLSCW
jgi:hypothetical protein